MRIAIPSNDGSSMARHPGRANGFIIYELIEDRVERLDYPLLPKRRSARSKTVEKQIVSARSTVLYPECQVENADYSDVLRLLKGCETVICMGIGTQLYKQLNMHGMQIIYCLEKNADRTAVDYASGALAVCDYNHCNAVNSRPRKQEQPSKLGCMFY